MSINIKTSAYREDVLGTLDGVGLAERIASGEIMATEAVEAAIERALITNPNLNAIVTETFTRAREKAKKPIAGPFAGVPTFIKDTDDVKGVPIFFGSRALSDKPSSRSSAFVRQYEALGLISLGKSSLPEFGLTGTTEPLSKGPASNPWHLDYSTGGSSGGSAALVAAGVVPIAHGNDGGGSIRVPAACCGLVGLKPSRSRLKDMDGSRYMPINIVNQGVLTRTVRDTAAFYAAAEKIYRNAGLPEIGLVLRPGKARLRIGLFTEGPGGIPCESQPAGAAMEAGRVCEELGHKVEKIPCPFRLEVLEDFGIYWGMLAFSIHHFGRMVLGKTVDKKKLEELTLGLSRHYRKYILKTFIVIRRLQKFALYYESIFKKYDILLSPVLSKAPFKLGYLGPDVPVDVHILRLAELIPFTPVQNVSGAPAITLPMGRCREGLPIGVQFATAYGQDRRLIELSFEIEEARPWPMLFDQ